MVCARQIICRSFILNHSFRCDTDNITKYVTITVLKGLVAITDHISIVPRQNYDTSFLMSIINRDDQLTPRYTTVEGSH